MWKSVTLSTIVLLCFFIPSSWSIPQPLPQGGGNGPIPSPINSMRCSKNEDCSTKFEDSECLINKGNFCQCKKGFMVDFDKCRPVILDLTSECAINAQCATGLGNLSRCNEEKHKCECYDTKGNGKNSTAYIAHTCYIRKALGDPCDLHEECKASIQPAEAVKCDVQKRVCVCGAGSTCENVPGAAGVQFGRSLGLLLMGLMAVKVIL
jgi:hypothetical protein